MEKKLRKNYFIDKRMQGDFIVKFCVFVIIAVLAVTALTVLFTRESTTVTIQNSRVLVRSTSDFIFPAMIQICLIVSISCAIAVGSVLFFMTHRIAGPVYRIKRVVDRLKQGDYQADFKLRSGDELKDLAASLEQFARILSLKRGDLEGKIKEISALEIRIAAIPALVAEL